MAGWLAAVSVALAQTGSPAGGTPAGKNKTLSPYYPTASTVDWSGESDTLPELLPPPPTRMNTPPAPPAAQSPIRQASAVQPPPMSPPGTPAPPPVVTPTAPPPPATTPVVPAAPSPSAAQTPNGHPALPPTVSGTGPSCSTGNCAQSWTCNPFQCCPPCGPNGRVWASAELLLWWTKGMYIPPLVTASPAGTPRALAGVLGAPTTRILMGDERINDDMQPGLRVRAGMWLDDCQLCGIEGSYFFLNPSTDRSFDCLDAPVLARPFFDVNPGVPNPLVAGAVGFAAPNSQLVCFPGVLNGTVTVRADTDFYGFDANARKNLCCDCCYRIDLLAGYRYLNLTDRLTIDEDLQVISAANPAIPLGTTFQVHDQFDVENSFNGGQVGVAAERRRGRWYIAGRTLVALGNTHSEVTISGFTRATPPGGTPMLNAGGLLTQPTNIGRYERDHFAVVYDSQAILGYQVTDGIRAFISYSYLYWNNVMRAGDQIDLVVNSSQIPPGTLVGAARPVFIGRDSDFWAQGVSFGLEVRY
jgi:hypothetical protein